MSIQELDSNEASVTEAAFKIRWRFCATWQYTQEGTVKGLELSGIASFSHCHWSMSKDTGTWLTFPVTFWHSMEQYHVLNTLRDLKRFTVYVTFKTRKQNDSLSIQKTLSYEISENYCQLFFVQVDTFYIIVVKRDRRVGRGGSPKSWLLQEKRQMSRRRKITTVAKKPITNAPCPRTRLMRGRG